MTHGEFMGQLPELMRSLRVERGVTLRQLEQKIGVSYAHLCRIENRRIDPRLSTALKIARWIDE